MATQARELGLSFGDSERIFLAEAGWMFVYSMSYENGRAVLRKYDRDFGTNRQLDSLNDVLSSWWRMISEP